MAAKLKLGLIGCGNIMVIAHVPAWSANREVEIAAVCDIRPEASEAAAHLYAIPKQYSDYRELLSDPSIDIIDIAVPNYLHAEIAIAALQAGKHVLCEKPDASSVLEAQRMADAARLSDRILLVMRNNRFRPTSQFLKAFAGNGRMGDIYAGRCGWIRRREIAPIGWFTNKEQSGGGPLIDLGVHFIDLAVWLMGNPKPVAVTAATYKKFGDKHLASSMHLRPEDPSVPYVYNVEDLATGLIRFDNGALLQIEFSWSSNIGEEQNFLELRGSEAGFSLINDTLRVFTEIEGIQCDISPRLPADPGGHKRYIEHFVDCVLGRAIPTITPDDGVDMIKILTAIYESASRREEVRL